MRALSSATLAAIAAGAVRPRALVQVQLVEATYGFWNDAGVLVTGGITYYGTGKLGSISAVAGVTNLGAPSITYTLSGLDPIVLQTFFTYTWHQRPIQLYLGLLDSSNTLVDTPSLMASGRMDEAKLKGGKGKSAALQIAAEDVSRRLAWTNPSVRSDGDQRGRLSTDTFMQYVATTAEKQIYWGQKQPRPSHAFSITSVFQIIAGKK